jgi:LytS/YehU family sensor histidine kinase
MMIGFKQFLYQSRMVFVWAVLAGVAMTWMMANTNNWGWFAASRVGVFTVSSWLFLWLGNAYLSKRLDELVSWAKQPLKRFAIGLAAMLLYTIGISYLLVWLLKIILHFDMGSDMREVLYPTVIITVIATMFFTSRAFLLNWLQAAVNAERLKRETIKAQYDSLRNQVNPHFLFNSLNALANLVHEDPGKAVFFIKALSNVYRYVLETHQKDVVPLSEEMKLVQSYLQLQQMRFGTKLSVEIGPLQTGGVAPLAIQTLVENAIKHNELSAARPLGISISCGKAEVIVSNTLQKKTTLAVISPGVGLANLISRYKFLCHDPVQVNTTATHFIVKLPLLTVD